MAEAEKERPFSELTMTEVLPNDHATPNVPSEQDQDPALERALLRLRQLMDSIRKTVKIESLQTAISFLQNDGKQLEETPVIVRYHLVRALLTRFGLYGWIDDLGECLHHLQVVQATVNSQEIKDSSVELQSISQLIQECRNSLDIGILDAMVDIVEQAVSSYSSISPTLQRVNLLVIGGNTLMMRYLKLGNVTDLHLASTKFQQAAATCEGDDAFTYVCLTSLSHIRCLQWVECGDTQASQKLGENLAAAAKIDGEASKSLITGLKMAKGAVDEAQFGSSIALLFDSLNHRKAPHPRRPLSLHFLARALFFRFARQGQMKDLEDCILLHRECLTLRPTHHPERDTSLESLSAALVRRFQTIGTAEDLQGSIILCRELLELRPESHPARSSALSSLGSSLCARFNHQGGEEDLEEAVTLLREAALATAPSHPDRSTSLIDLATALSVRFQHKGSIQDLEECIALYREAAEIQPRTAPYAERFPLLNNLAHALSNRFQQKAQYEDILESVALHREAVELVRESHIYRAMSLDGLAGSLSHRFGQSGMLEDLDEAILLHREALALRPIPHPDRGSSLNNLARALSTRSDHQAGSQDLEECIELYREALDLTSEAHPYYSMLLDNLAGALDTRFRQKRVIGDLGESIDLHRRALNLRPVPHAERPTTLSNLATALHKRFQEDGDIQDLNECIQLRQEVLKLAPPSHSDRSMFLNNLAIALSTRFGRAANLLDLEECILLHREALDLRPLPHPHRSMSLNNLANALSARFKQKGDFSDLENCIDMHREAIGLRPEPHPDRPGSLTNLANALSVRFEQNGTFEDLEESIDVHRKGLSLVPASHPHRPLSLNNLASAIRTRFDQKGDLNDLIECIALNREALELQTPPHPDRSMSLNNLATALLSQFGQQGGLKDLDECILLLREALDLRPVPHPTRSSSLSNLGTALWSRYEHKGVSQDLDECIKLHREALSLQLEPHPSRHMSMNNLANALSARFRKDRDLADLEECILLQREALNTLMLPHTNRLLSMNNLANALSIRFQQSGVLQDLEECIGLHRKALSLMPSPHPNRSGALHNLALAMFTCFKAKNATPDLEECIRLHREALELRPAPHPDRLTSLNNLAIVLLTRYEQDGTVNGDAGRPMMESLSHPAIGCQPEDDDIEIALAYYAEASLYDTGSLMDRLTSSRNWANCAQTHRPASALDAYHCAIGLLPQLASLDLTLQQRQDVLQHTRDLVGNAAKCAINANEYEVAATFLSTGRLTFWAQALQLRTKVDKLEVTHPTLAEKFLRISRQLEIASSSSLAPSSAAARTQLEGNPSLYKLASERHLIVEEIRGVPGFEDFMLPISFSSLRLAATGGPVIFLNASELGCDILLMLSTGEVKHIPLPAIHFAELKELRILLHALLEATTRFVAIQPDKVDGLKEFLGRDMARDGPLGANQDGFRLVLERLWVKVVRPVVEMLGLTKARKHLGLPFAKTLIRPQTDSHSLARIWWCPTGPFTSLPIHAAGIYSEDNTPVDCLFQYAISSYCTSPQDLKHDLSLPTSCFKMTAIIEPEVPGAAVLPATREELRLIEECVPNQHDLNAYVGSADASTNVSKLLSDIEHSPFVHFGCHGMQNLDDPLQSYLLLNGSKLTISRLIKDCQVPEGALAYLSACETAKGDEERPDESLNLVAAMMFAGFKSVVGTMWSISDVDAPIAAGVFYRHLFRHGNVAPPDVNDASYSLHLATKELRDRGKPFWSWVPYVHYGI